MVKSSMKTKNKESFDMYFILARKRKAEVLQLIYCESINFTQVIDKAHTRAVFETVLHT